MAVEHALSDAQSVATLQPHTPFTHAVSFACAEHATHAAPVEPHAWGVPPPTQVPFEQHPPWHGWPALHDVVQLEPLHAYPVGQSVVFWQRLVHMPPTQVCVRPHTWPTPHPPQLFGS